MANDLTLGLDVVIDKILGLGQFDALGKKLQSVVAKAVQSGLLEGALEGREILRPAYGKSADPARERALKRLYAYGAKVETNAEKAAAADERREQNRLASEARADAKRAKRKAEDLQKRKEQFASAEAAYKLYSPYNATTATDAYADSTIARQHLQYLTRISNRDIITPERLHSATIQQLIERSRANHEASLIRYDLPYNRLAREAAEAERQADRASWRNALQASDEFSRKLYEEEYGPVSDREWQQIGLNRTFGGDKIEAARERKAAREQKEKDDKAREAATKLKEEENRQAAEAAAALETLSKNAKIAGLILSGTSAGATMYYHSKWAQEAARDVTTGNMAYYQRWESGGQIAGGAIGAILGAMIGGPLGAIFGATGLGGIAGLWGNYKQKDLEGVLKTVATTTAARRDYLTFGGKSGFALGQAMEDAGFGSSSDLNNMRWTGRTLPGAMALGMVGEQDMLMLSLMPEYFAALMGGADAASLAQAYSTSVGRLPAQLQPLVSTMAPGGSTGMYANALDPQYARFLGLSSEFALRERAFLGASEFTMSASRGRARKNLFLAQAGIGEDMMRAVDGKHKDYFDMGYTSPMAGWAYSMYSSRTGYPAHVQANNFDTWADWLYGDNQVKTNLAYNMLNRLAETGLNLTIRVEGLGDVTQNFPFNAMSNGQTVSFNIGGM
jgi:uncharacterized protein YcfJ